MFYDPESYAVAKNKNGRACQDKQKGP